MFQLNRHCHRIEYKQLLMYGAQRGLRAGNPGSRFRRFLAEIASNALNIIDKSESQVVRMPSGGINQLLPPTGYLLVADACH